MKFPKWWTRKPIFLGQTPADIAWWTLLFIVVVDILLGFNSGSAIGSAMSLNQSGQMKLMAVEFVFAVLAGSQVLTEDLPLKELLNQWIHFAVLISAMWAISGKGEFSEVAYAIGSSAANKVGTFSYNANVAQPDNCVWHNKITNKQLTGDPDGDPKISQVAWCIKTQSPDCECR